MKTLIVFLVSCAVAVTAAPRIIQGDPIDIAEVPFMLQFEVTKRFTCGASIIGPNQVLTAGHCVNPSRPSDYRVRAGTSTRGSGTVYNVKEIIRHPQYSENNTIDSADYDIAFITTTETFEFSDLIQPVTIAKTRPVAGDKARVTGWGLTESGELPTQLLQANVSIIDEKTCEAGFTDSGIIIRETMLCTQAAEAGKGPCKGDSGGPLIVNGILVGLVSWGGNCDTEKGLAAVYTNVAYFSDWVEQQLQNSNKV